MAVKLRLRRQGRRNAPHYAIVVADSRAPRDGRFIEKIGYYNPIKKPAELFINQDAALKWLKVGAQPTDTVRSLMKHSGVNLRFALMKQGKSEETIKRMYLEWWDEKLQSKKRVIQLLNPPYEEEDEGEDLEVVIDAVAETVEETVAETTEEVVAETTEEGSADAGDSSEA